MKLLYGIKLNESITTAPLSRSENGPIHWTSQRIQVGFIGKTLPSDDRETVTTPGDIVLYAGDRLVVFYGSNSWAYTRLGRITDKTSEEMEELLSNGNVTVTISME